MKIQKPTRKDLNLNKREEQRLRAQQEYDENAFGELKPGQTRTVVSRADKQGDEEAWGVPSAAPEHTQADVLLARPAFFKLAKALSALYEGSSIRHAVLQFESQFPASISCQQLASLLQLLAISWYSSRAPALCSLNCIPQPPVTLYVAYICMCI